MAKMKRLLIRMNNGCAELSGWLVSSIMILLIIDFISRGFARPVPGVAELAVFSMIAVVYLGLAHCEEVRGHVKVTFLLDGLNPRLRALFKLFANLISALMIFLVIYAVGANALSAYRESEAVAGPTPLLTFPVKFVMTIALVFYFIQILINTIDDLKGTGGESKTGSES
jgi:TRAP-type C4-dicarboxylate transport system permease small subunit